MVESFGPKIGNEVEVKKVNSGNKGRSFLDKVKSFYTQNKDEISQSIGGAHKNVMTDIEKKNQAALRARLEKNLKKWDNKK